MFIISAEFKEQIEVNADLEKVRDFLFNLQNFAHQMPGVKGIRADAHGRMRWTIAVDIPRVGHVRQSFLVEREETPDAEIEWRPAAGEKENLLRYNAVLMPKNAGTTLVQISQKVELRRNSAKELHPLAALAGERLISKEMNKRVQQMISEFLVKAKRELEL